MLAVDRTTLLFKASLADAAPQLQVRVERSRTSWGRSNYVHIRDGARGYWKVRISDHAIGMHRYRIGQEDLHIAAGAAPSSWSVWLGGFCRRLKARAA